MDGRQVENDRGGEMTINWAWWLNVIGLVINTAAAVIVFFYPPVVTQFTAKGEPFITVVANPTEEGKRKGPWQRRLPRFALCLLGIGFLLQLLSALFSG
jgi:hypothetical protein